jgi:tRNA (adenine37-N6)-methyltransferase
MHNLLLKPIGVIHSPFQRASETPIQAALAEGLEGWVEIFPEFVPGLKDLEGFDRVWLCYWFDRAIPAQLLVKPFLDQHPHGVFATRSPCRPNPIGLSCVRLLGVAGGRLQVSGLDILDQTPLLDIKPYVPAFDCFEARRIGWLAGKGVQPVMADSRFELPEPKLKKLKQC